MKTILALDLGTHCGWAQRTEEGNTFHDVQKFETGRFDGGGMRYLRFARWLTEMKGGGLEAIYFEEVRHHSVKQILAAQVYGGFVATLTAWCESNSVPYQGVNVTTIKKNWTGKGNAKKEQMIAAARAKGFNVDDDNEADALAILHFAIDELGA